MSRKPNPKIDAQTVRHTEPTKLEIVPPTPEQEKPLKIVKDELATQLPMSVGNPDAAADLAIDQSHMEEFATVEDSSSEVVCDKPPKGIFFTVRPETGQALEGSRVLFPAADKGSRSLHYRPRHREAEEGRGRHSPRSARSLRHNGRRRGSLAAQARPAGRQIKSLEQIGADCPRSSVGGQVGAPNVVEGALPLPDVGKNVCRNTAQVLCSLLSGTRQQCVSERADRQQSRSRDLGRAG